MASTISRWLSTFAIITLMMTLVPLGSAAPAEAWSGLQTRDENVLRTGGISRGTRDTGTPLINNGAQEATTAEASDTPSIAQLDTSNTIDQRGGVADSQVVRLRASFFKNNTNPDIPSGGAPEIRAAYFMARDRSTGNWVQIKLTRGSDARWSTEAEVAGAGAIDGLMGFCVTGTTTTVDNWASNNGDISAGFTTLGGGEPADATLPVGLDQDTPAMACGTGGTVRPFVSSIQFDSSVSTTDTDIHYGVGGNNQDTLFVAIELAFPTPDVQGPVDFYTSVEDDDNYADGWDFYASTTMGEVPTVTGAPFSGGPPSAAAGTESSFFVTIEDRDGNEDIRAAIGTLVFADGSYLQLIFYNQVDIAYGTPGTAGTGSSIALSDIEERYQVFDSQMGTYRPTKPTDTGTITTSKGVLSVDASSFATSGDRLTVTFRFTPNASAAGATRLFAQGVDRELNSTGMVQVGSFTTSGG